MVAKKATATKKLVAKTSVKDTKPVRRHVKDNSYYDWDLLTVTMDPKILTSAVKFSETNNIVLSQLITSAVKVFISEAETYMEDQARARGQFMGSFMADRTELFRVNRSFTTAEACKESAGIRESVRRRTSRMNNDKKDK